MSEILLPENIKNPAPPAASATPADGGQTPAEETRLSQQTVNTLAGAVAQLVDLESRTIAQPNDEALKRELRNHIAKVFLKHSQEFIGCWFTVRIEYEPLCHTIAHVLGHVDGIRQRRFQQLRDLEKKVEGAIAAKATV